MDDIGGDGAREAVQRGGGWSADFFDQAFGQEMKQQERRVSSAIKATGRQISHPRVC